MDPDRSNGFVFATVGSFSRWTLLFLLFLGLTAFFLWLLGRTERDESGDAKTGISDLFAGLLALCGLSGGLMVVSGSLACSLLPLWGEALVFLAVFLLLFPIFVLGQLKADSPPPAWVAGLAPLIGRGFLLLPELIFRLRHLSPATTVTEEDILDLVDDAEEGDFIDESQKEMISAVFELDDIEAGELMTHRTEMEAVEETTTAREVIASALEKGFSRFPVYRKNLDDIVGILHVKDLLQLVKDPQGEERTVGSFMRSVMFVPESCHARELLLDFKAKHTQIAIVVDEYGGTAGIVTMEDILEEIVGNIQDEFDNEQEEMTTVEGGIETEGSTDIDDIFERFELEVPEQGEDEDFDSVGGMILQRLGRFPAQGEEVTVSYGGLEFSVLESGERKIERVLCRRLSPAEEQPG